MLDIEPTPLEEAVLSAIDFAAGIALSAQVQNLIDRSIELDNKVKDRTLDKPARAEALREVRDINNQLSIVSTMCLLTGVSA